MDLSKFGRRHFNSHLKKISFAETAATAFLTSTCIALAPEIITSFVICTGIKICSKIAFSELAKRNLISESTCSWLEPLGNQFCSFYVENLFSSKLANELLPRYTLKTLGMLTGIAHLSLMNKFFYNTSGNIGLSLSLTSLEEIFKNNSPSKWTDLPFAILGGSLKNILKNALTTQDESFGLNLIKSFSKSTVFYLSMEIIASRGHMVFESKFPRVVIAVAVSDLLTPCFDSLLKKICLKSEKKEPIETTDLPSSHPAR